MKKSRLYWICQLGGWAVFIILQVIFFGLANNSLNSEAIINFIFWYLFAVLLTHGFRFVIIKTRLINVSLVKQIPAVILGSIILAILFVFLQYLVASITIGHFASIPFRDSVKNTIDFTYVFFFWSLIYFSFHYIENYKKAEIANLRYKVSMNEFELNKLKSQLNTHFMFNAMNSIRALIDEDPAKAKEAVTMLSNILRNTLQMEKNKLINFDEEIKVVKDYLDLEHIRFERRLQYELEIPEATKNYKVPTLMVQTLVENGIKHGISKLVDGGKIILKAIEQDGNLFIQIKNSGKLVEGNVSETGYGLKNTQQRLELLYGGRGSFKIYNNGDFVITEVIVPKV